MRVSFLSEPAPSLMTTSMGIYISLFIIIKLHCWQILRQSIAWEIIMTTGNFRLVI